MNKNLKFTGLLAMMIPLFTVGLTLGNVGDAFATNVGSQDVIGRPGYQPDKVCGDRLCSGENGPNIGSQDVIGRPGYQPDKVCGDRLCSEPAAEVEAKELEPEAKATVVGPYFNLVDVQKASTNSENLYKAIFDVFAGEINVIDLKMFVKSDMETIATYAGSSMNAGDHSITTILIQALEPSSISGKILDWNDNQGSQNHLRP